MTDHIQPGRVFVSCHPGETTRLRVVKPLGDRVLVVDADTGKHPHQIRATSLHASGLTHDGQPRRTGYRPDDTEPNGEQPNSH